MTIGELLSIYDLPDNKSTVWSLSPIRALIFPAGGEALAELEAPPSKSRRRKLKLPGAGATMPIIRLPIADCLWSPKVAKWPRLTQIRSEISQNPAALAFSSANPSTSNKLLLLFLLLGSCKIWKILDDHQSSRPTPPQAQSYFIRFSLD